MNRLLALVAYHIIIAAPVGMVPENIEIVLRKLSKKMPHVEADLKYYKSEELKRDLMSIEEFKNYVENENFLLNEEALVMKISYLMGHES